MQLINTMPELLDMEWGGAWANKTLGIIIHSVSHAACACLRSRQAASL